MAGWLAGSTDRIIRSFGWRVRRGWVAAQDGMGQRTVQPRPVDRQDGTEDVLQPDKHTGEQTEAPGGWHAQNGG